MLPPDAVGTSADHRSGETLNKVQRHRPQPTVKANSFFPRSPPPPPPHSCPPSHLRPGISLIHLPLLRTLGHSGFFFFFFLRTSLYHCMPRLYLPSYLLSHLLLTTSSFDRVIPSFTIRRLLQQYLETLYPHRPQRCTFSDSHRTFIAAELIDSSISCLAGYLRQR